MQCHLNHFLVKSPVVFTDEAYDEYPELKDDPVIQVSRFGRVIETFEDWSVGQPQSCTIEFQNQHGEVSIIPDIPSEFLENAPPLRIDLTGE